LQYFKNAAVTWFSCKDRIAKEKKVLVETRKLTKSGRAPLGVVFWGEQTHAQSVLGYENVAGIGSLVDKNLIYLMISECFFLWWATCINSVKITEMKIFFP
jgi:hypothetical protein